MANIKSQKKRNITNEKARMRNRAVRSELKTATRTVREAVEAGDGAAALTAAHEACRLLDRAVTKGVIHKSQAANRKSGIMKLANTVVTDEDRAAFTPRAKKAPAATGNKKAAARAERKEAKKAAAAEKEVRKAEAAKEAEAAAAKKAAEEAAAAEAEAAAAAEAEAEAEAAEEAVEEAPAEEAAE